MAGRDGLTILAVDDQPDMLSFLALLLGKEGYQVRKAYTGAEGIALAQDPAVDLVLLDVMLPDIDGFQVCLKIKEQRPRLPVIHVTVRDKPVDKVTGLESGADDYVTKPFSSRVLLARIRAALRKNQGQRANLESHQNNKTTAQISNSVKTVAQPLTRLFQKAAIAEIVVQHAWSEMQVEHAALCIWRQNAQEMTREHIIGSDPKITTVLQSLGQEWGQTLYDELHTQQQTIVVDGSHSTPAALVPLHTQMDCRTMLVAPLIGQHGLYGVLFLLRQPQSTFSAEELALAADMTARLGSVMDYAHALGQIERSSEAEFEHLEQMPEILSVISHELRSPVAAIKGFITTLLSNHRYWDDRDREAFLEKVNESVDQLSRLVENVLEMGRLDKGLRIHRRSTRLASVVQRVLHDLSFQANRCELVNEVPTQLPIIAADPLRIERVLRNLLENAIKFSPQGGRIRVFARLTEKEIVVGVEDQGIGIAPEHLQHIFERFYQVDHTEVPKEGVGLGLSIVRELVHAHNGRVWAESGVGSGTTVHFSLPLDSSSVMPERDSVGGNHIALDLDGLEGGIYPALEHPTILIAEDDHEMRQFLHETLEQQGFRILTTRFGKPVLDLVQRERPDLILLDLTLPDVDGLTVCQQVRRVSNVPIIIITGRTAEHHQVRGLTLGADDYLIKPFTSRELLAHIRAVLRRAQMPGKTGTPSPLRFDGLEISPTSHEVISPTGTVKLTPTEHKILWYLASNAGQTLTHEQLLIHVWGFDSEHSSDYLWVIISRLRKKIEPEPGQPRYILTEPGLGYRFKHSATTHALTH